MATTFSNATQQTTQPSLSTRISALARDVGNIVRDHLELAALEAQRAAVSLAKVLSAAVVISILVVTAWLSFVASAIVWATDAGVSWPVALVGAGISKILPAGGARVWVPAPVRRLGIPRKP